MINISNDLNNKIKSTIEELGFKLYYIDQQKIGNQTHLIIYINKENYDNSISIEDCVLVTQSINEFIDEYIDEEYMLEISSTGINRQLFEEWQYKEVVGELVKLKLRSNVEGFLNKQAEGLLETVNTNYIKIDGIEINKDKIKSGFYMGGKHD